MSLAEFAQKRVKAMGLDCDVESDGLHVTLRLKVTSPRTGKTAIIGSVAFFAGLPNSKEFQSVVEADIKEAAAVGMKEPAARALNG